MQINFKLPKNTFIANNSNTNTQKAKNTLLNKIKECHKVIANLETKTKAAHTKWGKNRFNTLKKDEETKLSSLYIKLWSLNAPENAKKQHKSNSLPLETKDPIEEAPQAKEETPSLTPEKQPQPLNPIEGSSSPAPGPSGGGWFGYESLTTYKVVTIGATLLAGAALTYLAYKNQDLLSKKFWSLFSSTSESNQDSAKTALESVANATNTVVNSQEPRAIFSESALQKWYDQVKDKNHHWVKGFGLSGAIEKGFMCPALADWMIRHGKGKEHWGKKIFDIIKNLGESAFKTVSNLTSQDLETLYNNNHKAISKAIKEYGLAESINLGKISSELANWIIEHGKHQKHW